MRKKPTQLKKIEGTLRKDRANHREPKPKPADSLEPPIKLDSHGRAFWDYHAAKLKGLGLLTECDTYSLAIACEWWSVHRRALEGLKTDLVHSTDSNGECCRPELTAAKQAFGNLQTLMQRFGLDPQSRSKISVPTPEDKDPIGELYFKKRPQLVAV